MADLRFENGDGKKGMGKGIFDREICEKRERGRSTELGRGRSLKFGGSHLVGFPRVLFAWLAWFAVYFRCFSHVLSILHGLMMAEWESDFESPGDLTVFFQLAFRLPQGLICLRLKNAAGQLHPKQ